MIKDNKLEKTLKDFYTEKTPIDIKERQDCPTQLELSDYLEKRLSLHRQEWVIEHISSCQRCLSLIELAQRAQRELSIFPMPPAGMVIRAKKVALPSFLKKVSQHKWLMLTVVPFALSFIFPRYFLQFLIAAVILGLKWVFDTATSRTLIMVYEAWRKKDNDFFQKERDIFHNSQTKMFP